MWFYYRVRCPKDADRMASSVDPGQRSSRIWVYTVCQDLSVRKFRIIMVFSNSAPRQSQISAAHTKFQTKLKFHSSALKPVIYVYCILSFQTDKVLANSADPDQTAPERNSSPTRVFCMRLSEALPYGKTVKPYCTECLMPFSNVIFLL